MFKRQSQNQMSVSSGQELQFQSQESRTSKGSFKKMYKTIQNSSNYQFQKLQKFRPPKLPNCGNFSPGRAVDRSERCRDSVPRSQRAAGNGQDLEILVENHGETVQKDMSTGHVFSAVQKM